jgi:aminodeoxyfutalosine synthase
VNRAKNGNVVTFAANQHINPTNICVLRKTCVFCGYARLPKEDGAYRYSLEQVLQEAAHAADGMTREFHIVGGLDMKAGLAYYTEMFRALKANFPHVHIKALTAVEIAHIARIEKMSVPDVLAKLRDAGLDTLPGGGAEVFGKAVRATIADRKLAAEDWISVHRTAHGMGIRSNCTMLYGHVESLEDRVDHLLRLRELQDETGGFVTFIPLAFQPWEAPAMKLPETTGFDDLKAIAVARLMLDNVPHVKSYWIMITPRLAQVGLSFGADDIDGTVTEEKIAHDAGAQTPQVMTVHELVRLVREAGRRPVERDTVFNVVREW